MSFQDINSGIAASIYLALYLIYLAGVLVVIYNVGWKTRFTSLFIFALIRVGAMIAGVGFAIVGFEHYQWLIAYLILGAEGYFALVFGAMHFIATFQKIKTGNSWLRPEISKAEEPSVWKRIRIRSRSPIGLFHNILIPANTIIIVGGSYMSGVSAQDFTTSSQVHLGRILRTVGQAIFLLLVQIMIFCAIRTYRQGIRGPTLYCVLATWPFLTVRGAWGILSSYTLTYSYYNPNNYTDTGLSSAFLSAEYLMGTTMEFISASLLLASYFAHEGTVYVPPEHNDAEKVVQDSSQKV